MSIGRRQRIVMLLTALSLTTAGAADAHSGVVLSGVGTPTVDGVMAPGEWDAAARIDFAARVPSNDGGGTKPGSLLVMNDGTNLYVALRLSQASAPRGSFVIEFDNDHDGIFFEQGEDGFVANPGTFYTDFFRTTEPPCPAGVVCGLQDAQLGGTNDGRSATGDSTFVYEVSKPLDTADDAHDFSLKRGDTVGFWADVQVWSAVPSCNFGPSCVEATTIASGADIVVAGRDATPPALAVPSALDEDATSPAGATVQYGASATDDVDGAVPVSCVPASGSVFAIGATRVTCAAADAAGNTASASFVVRVKSAAEQLADLRARLNGVGPGTSLADKVSDVQAALASGNQAKSCEALAAFANQVSAQGGKSISAETAASLGATAARIRRVLAC